MSSVYPVGFDPLPDIPADADQDDTGFFHDVVHSDERAAIRAVQSVLGLDPAGTFGTVVDRLDDVDGAVGAVETDVAGLDTRTDATEALLAAATSAATADRLVKRDGNADASFRRVLSTLAVPDGPSVVTRKDYVDAGDAARVPYALYDAKGDLLIGSADDGVVRLAVGADGTVLTADSSTASGLKWAAAAGGGVGVLHSGTGSPTSGIGSNGDWYRNEYGYVWGPKTSGAWPTHPCGRIGAHSLAGGSVPVPTGGTRTTVALSKQINAMNLCTIQNGTTNGDTASFGLTWNAGGWYSTSGVARFIFGDALSLTDEGIWAVSIAATLAATPSVGQYGALGAGGYFFVFLPGFNVQNTAGVLSYTVSGGAATYAVPSVTPAVGDILALARVGLTTQATITRGTSILWSGIVPATSQLESGGSLGIQASSASGCRFKDVVMGWAGG